MEGVYNRKPLETNGAPQNDSLVPSWKWKCPTIFLSKWKWQNPKLYSKEKEGS